MDSVVLNAYGALVAIAAMVALIFLIAWREFGRPRHALVWSIGFAIATLMWGVELAVEASGGAARCIVWRCCSSKAMWRRR